MPRPIQALIHADALAHNLVRARRAAGDARVWAVVKANAYGHGIERVFAGLRGADGFALLDLAEAQRLRTLGWRGPILLLEGCFEARDLEHCSRLKLTHVVHHDAQIDLLAAHKTTTPHHVVLKANSGMNRLGFAPERLRAAWLRLSGLTQVDGITLATHFANADAAEGGEAGVAAALARFETATHDLPGERSLCNSAALLRLAESALRLRTPAGPVRASADWVRPGIMLYGSAPDFPSGDIAGWDLQPAMSLRAGVIATQHVQPGEGVGYGAHYVAERAMRIGIVACGYADGYPRHAPSGTPVLVDGVRSALAGRVSMDMVAVDLTPAPAAGVGSEVTLWGRAGNGTLLPIDEVAHAAGTVGYELMCALAPRVPVALARDAAAPAAVIA